MWLCLFTPIPLGQLNWPSPDPRDPNLNKNSPFDENASTRWLLESATRMVPSPFTATPCGSLNWPSPDPRDPKLNSSSPSDENDETWWLLTSVTRMELLVGLNATNRGSSTCHCRMRVALIGGGDGMTRSLFGLDCELINNKREEGKVDEERMPSLDSSTTK